MKKLFFVGLLVAVATSAFGQNIEQGAYGDADNMEKDLCTGRVFDRVVTGDAKKNIQTTKRSRFECDEAVPSFLLGVKRISPDVLEVLQDVSLSKGHKITVAELKDMITYDPDVSKLLAIKDMYFNELARMGSRTALD